MAGITPSPHRLLCGREWMRSIGEKLVPAINARFLRFVSKWTPL